MKAVMLYIKHDFSAADTILELGYAGRKTLVRRYREYQATPGKPSGLPERGSTQQSADGSSMQ